MFFRCKACNKYWKAHDSSNSVQDAWCNEHREQERKRLMLPPRRGPVRPFSDYNPRPTRAMMLEHTFFRTTAVG